MRFATIRDKMIDEITLIPDNKLEELYDVIHHYRLGLASQGDARQILQFAGCWNDLPEQIFDEFLSEIAQRRQRAFSRRRFDETNFG